MSGNTTIPSRKRTPTVICSSCRIFYEWSTSRYPISLSLSLSSIKGQFKSSSQYCSAYAILMRLSPVTRLDNFAPFHILWLFDRFVEASRLLQIRLDNQPRRLSSSSSSSNSNSNINICRTSLPLGARTTETMWSRTIAPAELSPRRQGERLEMPYY